MSTKSSADLVASSEHLFYEFWMLDRTMEALSDPRIEAIPGGWQAVRESFLVHARALHDFFTNVRPRSGDVVAGDFDAGWAAVQPALRETASLRDSIGKEIAHLTVARLKPTPTWPYKQIHESLHAALDTFLGRVAAGMLSQQWAAPAPPTGAPAPTGTTRRVPFTKVGLANPSYMSPTSNTVSGSSSAPIALTLSTSPKK